jgi:hypothetical protein
MSIPKKGSRTIVVHGTTYRWLIRSKPTYAQALAQSPLSFAAELESLGQSSLVVNTSVSRPDAWIEPSGVSITPNTVVRAIRRALQLGWQPEKSGNPFTLSDFAI